MIVVVVTVVILTLFLITALRQRSNCPPGPFPWPFIGNQYYLQKLSRELGGQHLAFQYLSKKYNSGILSLRLGNQDIIVVTDSKIIHEICVTEEYDGRPWNEFTKLRNMGLRKGITMNDGPEWRELRHWTVRTLRNVGFAKREMMELLVDELAIILEKLKSNNVQCIRPVIAPAVINVLWMLVTGKRPSEDLSRLQTFINLLERRAQCFDMTGGLLASFPWLRYIAPEMSGYNLLVALNNELKDFVIDTINEHKKRYIKGSEMDFIDMFLYEMYSQQDNIVFSDENLLVTLIDFFIAGTNNTAATLDILFLQMANYQDVQRKLHEEIDTVIGSRFPVIEDRVKMPFTEAILTESQRLWLVTPIIGPRRVLANTILDGYKIPKNAIILMDAYCNNMNPEFFPEPTSFKPERHILKDGTHKPHENILLFGKGKRRCPGEALARSAMFLLFVGVMQKYRLLPMPGEKFIKMELSAGLTIAPKPYEMLILPR
ncbi:probable cytochrome P450 305a1 [Pogonomyrmex barbatus]|uniref:Probable cytochrome P450 305a1 n=1 Tax=Pogonomyrmex barbatus TaxID=144034 RepID=A0A6I9WSI0_9HYME|nr:probable cytochrome P450 305a1 [Pogonomyrmex barbatus]XP_011646187.1 probable cytochrome P450 305a1 [Pogonomyrmex barbatus]